MKVTLIMKNAVYFLLTVSMVSTYGPYGVNSSKTVCSSPQYLVKGKTGSITCFFPNEFFILLWYTSTDFENDSPTVRFKNLVKSGTGYESGTFDVHPNGSLIIKEVLLEHDDVFTLAYSQSKEDFYEVISVRVIVVVQPDVPFPIFEQCDDVKSHCFKAVENDTVQCCVRGARPNVSLSFAERTVDGDKHISSDEQISPEGLGYTTCAITRDIFQFSSFLVLLVCKASSPPGMLGQNHSIILVQNSNKDIIKENSISVFIEIHSTMELTCTDNENGFIVWKRVTPPNYKVQQILFFSIFIGENYTEKYENDVKMVKSGSLLFHSVKLKDEGIYTCVFGNGFRDGMISYEVKVFVSSYPIIEGCGTQQYCVLEAPREGSLTCSVKGIRPLAKLQWNTSSNNNATSIFFINEQTIVVKNGQTFNVTLISKYRIPNWITDRLTVECKLVASYKDTYGLKTKVDLLLVKGNTFPTDHKLPWIITITLALVLLFGSSGIIIVLYFQNHTERKERGDKAEEATMVDGRPPATDSIFEMKDYFLKQIREKYKDLYDAVQPIPYVKDRLYCVDRIFVECGIEFLDSKRGGEKGQWTSLSSYQNVFNDNRIKSVRRILEGEPGYGKSTVTLQCAFDWCNSIQASPLKDFDILIILRLRQLGGVLSIYRAIKQYILPKESRLTEYDIRDILLNSHSVAVILDGFDEYPDQGSSTSDIISIIAREMFQDFEVVLTTRSSFLPNKYPPLTKRIRLTGFDDDARRYYIRKAVVGDDDSAVQKLEEYLQENPILSDLCQVPLLFVIFAHMTHESEQFRKLNSVTSFFRHMISCFHNHLKNKIEEKYCKYEYFETKHNNLDKVAFEALSGHNQKIVWRKDDLSQELGQRMYDLYTRIGILVEEESFNINDEPGTDINEHIQSYREVRFYHKLFCEWYAAHYLVDYLKINPKVDTTSFLKPLNPFDLQYMYRFACGIDPDIAHKIIEYLTKIEGGDKFAILCILEQTGKIDNIKETIIQFCDEGVIISDDDSLLLQRSSAQLLEMAARLDIPVREVNLYNCFKKVDPSADAVITNSNCVLTSKIPTKLLVIHMFKRKLTSAEATAIFHFSSKCMALKRLEIVGHAPPQTFTDDSALQELESREITVTYLGAFNACPKYILDLKTGTWKSKTDGRECTNKDFDEMNAAFDKVRDRKKEDYIRIVKGGREGLRLEAEQRENEKRV